MTEKEALEKHKEDCKRCNLKICKMPDNKNECLQEIDIKVYEELLRYREIGTVKECQDATEKQIAKKIDFEMNFGDFESRFVCRCGKRIIVHHDRGIINNHNAPNYCPNCGQSIDWS